MASELANDPFEWVQGILSLREDCLLYVLKLIVRGQNLFYVNSTSYLKSIRMETTDPILIKMDQYVEKWKSSQDSRHIFLSCYRLMSSNMIAAIKNDEFHDTDWVKKLLHRFADYYFESLTYDSTDSLIKYFIEFKESDDHKDAFNAIKDVLLTKEASLEEDIKWYHYNYAKVHAKSLLNK